MPDCPICLDDIETSTRGGTRLGCGHSYCFTCCAQLVGSCAPACALCRRSVTLVMLDARARAFGSANHAAIRDLHARAAPPWNVRFAEAPRLAYEAIRGEVLGHGLRADQARTIARAFGAFAVAYFASPFDCVPEFLGVLGWMDDVLVVVMVCLYVANITRAILTDV